MKKFILITLLALGFISTNAMEERVNNEDIITEQQDAQVNTDLIIAVQNGNIGLVNLLLQSDADVNARNYKMQTALTEAVAQKNVAIVKALLLENKVDTNNAKDALYKAKGLWQLQSSSSPALAGWYPQIGWLLLNYLRKQNQEKEIPYKSIMASLEQWPGECESLKMLIGTDNTVDEVLFRPNNNIRDMLIALIDREEECIKIAIYQLCDEGIKDALIRAHGREVVIKLVADRCCKETASNSVIPDLNFPIWIHKVRTRFSYEKMHNKFCIFKKNIKGKALIWNGSFNFSFYASRANQENVTIRDNQKIINKFKKQFKLLKHHSEKINISKSIRPEINIHFRRPEAETIKPKNKRNN